jgi:ATP-binding cassette subfamily B protein
MATPSSTEFALYRRLLRQAQPYWPHLGGLFLLSLLASPLALLTPLPLKMAVDSVVGSHQQLPGPLAALLPAAVTRSHTALLVVAAVLFVLIALLTQLQQLGSSVLSAYTGEKLVLNFRVRLFRHVQRLSLLYHDLMGTTDSTYRIQYDATSIQNITVNGVLPFISAAITIASMIYVTARIDWQLALVALAVSPVLFVVARAYRQRLRRQWGDAKKLESCAMSVVQEVLAAMRVVKAFGQEHYEQERFICQSTKGLRARVHLACVAGSFGLLVGLITAVGTAVVLFIGMRHVQAGVLTLGELLLVMSYLTQLYLPLQTISKRAADLQASLASAERAFALLDEVADVTERPNARPLARASGAVTFRKVCFAYSTDHAVLHDLSFEIGPGTHLGIAGTTGAGKTTLVSLLTRFYDPTAGQILLDGVDLRAYKLADLRNQFAIVLQEPVLFSSSIAENIAYARPGASDHEIVVAAQAANAHEFIAGLPQGYETQVGERGMRLSGGERQRISLARAFLKDAPILLLDEPTSSVDTKTEAAIMEAMERLMHSRTTFIIAHRLGTLANCDALLQIEQGRLVEATAATLRADKEAEAVAHGAGDGPVMGAEPMAKDATIEIVTREHTTSLKSLAHQPLLFEAWGEHSATAYEKTGSTTDKQRQEPPHSADECGEKRKTITIIPAKETATKPLLRREKSTSQHIPRFFQSRALLIIGLVLLLALGGLDGMKLLSLSQRSSGTTVPLTSATHTPLATRTAHVTPTVTTASPAPRNAYPPPTATATPRNGLSLAGTYNGSMFDQTTQQTIYISVFLVQSEGNAALSGMVTFKSPSQGVHPLHGTVETHGNFSFTVQLSAGQAPLYFYGTVQQQQGSYLKGDMCRSSTNACSVNTGYFLVGPRY